MTKLPQVNITQDENKNLILLFFFVSDTEEVKTIPVNVDKAEIGAFFNMFAQMYTVLQNGESNPFVTMGEFTVSIPVNVPKPRFYRKTELQKLLEG